MHTTSRAGWLVAALLCAASWISAQSSTQDDLLRADKQFDLYAYNLALRTYEQVLQKDPNNARALARTADCYFQLNRPEESLPWYERAAQQYNVEPEAMFRYGKALMQTGDYVGAKKWFRIYGEHNPSASQQYINMCDYAAELARKEPMFSVRNEALNTESADYCPAFLGNRVVYSSARTDMVRKSQPKSAADWSGSAYNQLYVTQRSPESGTLQRPAFLRSDLQNSYNEGPVSFSADGKRVAFCRNNFIDGTRQIAEKGINMSLYTADVVDGNWMNIKALPYNGSDYATGFPALSPNGNVLVFASNQPGGQGGWDLYVSNWNGSGWSQPRNLGAPLNTPGNEVTPFYDGKDLYFASDWHRGLGGLDVFRAELGRELVSNVYHLGPGINSNRDDYGLIFDAATGTGYITSNRPGGRGHEDIWQVTQKGGAQTPATYSTTTGTGSPFGQSRPNDNAPRPQEYGTTSTTTTDITNYGSGSGTLFLLVTDKSGNPVPNADLDFSDCNAGFGQTDYEGKYYFSSTAYPVRCNVVVKKEGFAEEEVILESYGKGNLRISIAPDLRQEYSGIVRDARTREPIAGVNVEIPQAENGKTVLTTTNYDGRYTLLLLPRGAYELNYLKTGYKSASAKMRPGITGIGNSLTDVLMEPTASSANNYERPAQYNTGNSGGIAVIASQKTEASPANSGDFNGYAVQLSAYPSEPTDAQLRQYEELTKQGNLYVKQDAGRHKVRLGIFANKSDALEAQKKAAKKHKGAFVVEEYGADPSLVVGQGSQRPAEYSTVSTTKGKPTPTPAILYAIQLGSFSAEKPVEIGDFASVAAMGHLYTKIENGMTKVRLGVYASHEAAEQAQSDVVFKGYQDAIIVTEKSSDESLRGFVLDAAGQQPAQYSTTEVKKNKMADKTNAAPRPTEYSTPSTAKPKVYPYYVRIATLSNPERFDNSPFADLGSIEKRPAEKGGTIILLGGFEKIEDVTLALNTVRERGFQEAYAVKDEKGKLSRVK